MKRYNAFWSRISASWCSLVHPDPMWPINGFYTCPKCQRRYRVPWDDRVSGSDKPAVLPAMPGAVQLPAK